MLPARCQARNHIVPTGMPLDQFRRCRAPRRAARLGWPLDERVVLCAANPARGVKNYPLAVEAHRALQAVAARRDACASPGAMREDEMPLDQLPLWMNAPTCCC